MQMQKKTRNPLGREVVEVGYQRKRQMQMQKLTLRRMDWRA
jgi:hypothetical protein